MTALNRIPENTNYLQPTKFLVTFPRIPGTQFFCKSVNIPGISIGTFDQPTEFRNLPVPGNKLTFDDFSMTFNIDEDLESWKQIHDWIYALGIPTKFDDYKALGRQMPWQNQTPSPQYSDGTLTILSGLNNPKYRINFKDMFPVSVSGIDFDVSESADTILTASVTFKYAYYDLVKL